MCVEANGIGNVVLLLFYAFASSCPPPLARDSRAVQSLMGQVNTIFVDTHIEYIKLVLFIGRQQQQHRTKQRQRRRRRH